MHNPDLSEYAREKVKELEKVIAETIHFQVVYTQHHTDAQMFRHGVPSRDRAACETVATDLIQRNNVKEVFICTVHAAYQKETTVRKVI